MSGAGEKKPTAGEDGAGGGLLDWIDPSDSWDFTQDRDIGRPPEGRPRQRPPGFTHDETTPAPVRRRGSLFEDPVAPPLDPATDFAGTRPRHDPGSLLPTEELNLPPRLREDIVPGTAVEEDLEGRPLETVAREHTAPPPPSGRRGGRGRDTIGLQTSAASLPPSQRRRFGFAQGALLAIGAVAVIGAALVASHDQNKTQRAVWSAWAPVKGDKNRPVELQIGQHLGPNYKLATGEQMVDVTSTGPLIIGDQLAGIALRLPPDAGGDLVQVDPTKVSVYEMCGYGPDCKIAEGTPSAERALLIQREALELALYTFHYTKAQLTIVRTPTSDVAPTTDEIATRVAQGMSQAEASAPAKVSRAYLFRRDALQPLLDQPIDASLTSRPPSVPDVDHAVDTPLVKEATVGSLGETDQITDPNTGIPYLVMKIYSQATPTP